MTSEAGSGLGSRLEGEPPPFLSTNAYMQSNHQNQADMGNTNSSKADMRGSRPSKSSLADMEKMRKEIKQLQEKRAAAMMNEVVELQSERDTALGRVKILKQTLEDLTVENAVLKETIGQGDQVQRLFHLEKSLLEEQLYSSDLKKKLQSANKQITTLKTKVKSLEVQRADGGKGSMFPLGIEEDSILERSRSMNDLEQDFDKNESGMEQKQKGGSPPSQYHLPRLIVPKQRDSPLSLTVGTGPSLKPPSSIPTYSPSPTIIPRRYRLTSTQSRTVGTQIDFMDRVVLEGNTGSQENITKHEMETLKHEKQVLENKISEMREEEIEEQRTRKKLYKEAKTESDMLRNSLSEFSRWVRQKIQLVEEDIDVCRVIYTLHGSLSQEAALLKELQDRLGHSEQKIAELTAKNNQLREAANYSEEKYKQAKQQNELLKEKIVLLTPTKSSKQTFYPSPLTSSPRQHRAPHHMHPSPLTSYSSPSSSPGPPLRHHHHDNGKTTPTALRGSPVRSRKALYTRQDSEEDSAVV